jgi:hypothetical protein
MPRPDFHAAVDCDDQAVDLTAASVRPLEYGRGGQASWRLRKRHVIVAALLLGCVTGSWVVGRSAREHTQNLLYVRQASRHVEPANTIVFESDPARAQALLDAGTHIALAGGSASPAVLREPDSLRLLRGASGGAALETMGALVFLHELVTPSGARRIVAVQFLPHYIDGRTLPGAGLVAYIFEPGGLVSAPRQVGQSHARLLVPVEQAPLFPETQDIDPLLQSNSAAACLGTTSGVLEQAFDPWGGTQGLRWYAGQPDELDSTHFTIDYEIAGIRGTVDGYLSDDGGHVRMQPRAPHGSSGTSGGYTRINAPLNSLH